MRLDKNKTLLAMAKKDMLQKDLAQAAHMSSGNLSTVINGKNCKPETIIRIAKVLGVDAEELIEK